MKKILVLLAVLAIAFTCAGNLMAAGNSGSTATVIKIEGNRITLKDDQGRLSTVLNDPAGIRIGQTVRLQNGRIAGSTSIKPGELNPGEPVGINPQPEPPGKNL